LIVVAASSIHLGEFAPPVVAMGAYAVAYRVRARTLAREHRAVAVWRQCCFLAGVALVVVAITPPVDELADSLFAAHMAQHVLLGDLAALLIALGLTGPLLQPLLRRRPNSLLRAVSHPGPAFALWAVDLYLWHTPLAYQAALRSDLLHSVEHACFFLFGLNMWIALLGPLPKPAWFGNLARLGYVIVVRLTSALLANVLIWSGSVFYPYYTAGEQRHGLSALNDQGAAGAIMLVTDSVVTICLFGWLFMRAAAQAERRQQLLEAATAHQVALTPERAARAVAAGRDRELMDRIATGSL
jgi:putative membrane protein